MKALWLVGLLLTALAGCGDTTPDDCSRPDDDGDGVDDVNCGGTDCDDTDPNRFPGNTELCDEDHHDEDCDPNTFGTRDRDGDGAIARTCCNDRGGVLVCGDDCNDDDPMVRPGNQEICNGIDDDCNGSVDDGTLVEAFTDIDGDGFGEPGTSHVGCADNPDISLIDGDCDDRNPQIFPGSIVCRNPDGQFPAAYDFCQTDGTYKPASCAGSQVCVQQPGGHGVCEI